MRNVDKNRLSLMIVLGLAIFLMVQLINGNISYYIHQRFNGLVVFAVVVLPLVVAARIWLKDTDEHSHEPGDEHSHAQHEDHQHGAPSTAELVLLLIPLLIGILIPARPLTSAAFDAREINLSAPVSAVSQPIYFDLEFKADEYSILDWLRLFGQEEHSSLVGEEASIIGFIYHDDNLAAGQVMVGRFVVTCCSADAFPVGMIVELPPGVDYADDTWVKIQGNIAQISYNGSLLPLIQNSQVEEIEPPRQPYLFP